jgi:chemotaxis protein methyltransferase CheR
MVASRLAIRLLHNDMQSYGQYYQLLISDPDSLEFQLMVNSLTTNETYFFREPKHFDFFKEQIIKPWNGDKLRLWSAASSTGEEAYSLAMTLAEGLGTRSWEVFGSDINTEVVDTARRGIYLMDRLHNMEQRYMDEYCLKGVRSQENYFRVDENMRNHVNFDQLNLKATLPRSLGQFDVIFLRNVLIYFDAVTKQDIVTRVISALKPGGYFFISHSETLRGITTELLTIRPSIYQKPWR